MEISVAKISGDRVTIDGGDDTSGGSVVWSCNSAEVHVGFDFYERNGYLEVNWSCHKVILYSVYKEVWSDTSEPILQSEQLIIDNVELESTYADQPTDSTTFTVVPSEIVVYMKANKAVVTMARQ